METALRRGPLLWTVAALSAGCGGALGTPPCADGQCGTQVSMQRTFQYPGNRKVDVLFVIDDTAAIAPDADAVANGLGQLAAQLDASSRPPQEVYYPPPISWHVGVVRAGSCDTSTRAAACGVAAPDQFLRSEWCGTITNYNYPGNPGDAFTCLADLGTADCGPPQPLAAAVQVLTGARAGWQGFLRPEAYLLVVVIAAGDDASPQPVSDLVAAIRGLKADPYQTAASIIAAAKCAAGVPQRLADFAQSFGANGLLIDLCDGQFDPALERVASFINDSLLPPCLSDIRDADAATPGLQPVCTLLENSLRPDGSIMTRPLPSCDAGQPPCWRTVAGTCGTGRPGWFFSIDQALDQCIDGGVNFTLECLSCVDPADPACAGPP